MPLLINSLALTSPALARSTKPAGCCTLVGLMPRLCRGRSVYWYRYVRHTLYTVYLIIRHVCIFMVPQRMRHMQQKTGLKKMLALRHRRNNRNIGITLKDTSKKFLNPLNLECLIARSQLPWVRGFVGEVPFNFNGNLTGSHRHHFFSGLCPWSRVYPIAINMA